MSQIPTAFSEDACREAAKQAHLRYVRDSEPGITRARHGKGFRYFAPNNDHITAEDVIERINSLAIPPAYESVWICPLPNGHLQATGRDDRKRKQYRYHPKWAEVRSETKFGHMAEFAEALPKLRRIVDKHLSLPDLPKERVMASIVRLMDISHMRVGNVQYAEENKTYGLTTLRKKHVELNGSHIRFSFTGKSGKEWQRNITDRKVAKTIQQCEEIPGQELFKYIDEAGHRHPITSDDINSYLQEITGQPFTAKDFRTWAATAQAIEQFAQLAPATTKREAKQLLTGAIKDIAEQLGHTPTICRQSYIHPKVLSSYEEGTLANWYPTLNATTDHQLVTAFLSQF